YGVWGSGGKGGNFVETMLRLAKEGKPLRVVDDQVCTPSYTADVAAAVVPLLATEAYGLYHLTNGGGCSWHGFARTIFDLAGGRRRRPAAVTPRPAAAPPPPTARPGPGPCRGTPAGRGAGR